MQTKGTLSKRKARGEGGVTIDGFSLRKCLRFLCVLTVQEFRAKAAKQAQSAERKVLQSMNFLCENFASPLRA